MAGSGAEASVDAVPPGTVSCTSNGSVDGLLDDQLQPRQAHVGRLAEGERQVALVERERQHLVGVRPGRQEPLPLRTQLLVEHDQAHPVGGHDRRAVGPSGRTTSAVDPLIAV